VLKYLTLVSILIAIAAVFFIYADDILLLAPRISGLRAQVLVNNGDMCVNAKTSQCIRLGRRYKTQCGALTTVSGGAINWIDCCRYLGVFFNNGCTFKCNFDNDKSCIFLFMKVFRTTSPAVVKCCQQAFNFLRVHSQLDIHTANFLHKFMASENSLCYLFASTARRKLNELFSQFDNVTICCMSVS